MSKIKHTIVMLFGFFHARGEASRRLDSTIFGLFDFMGLVFASWRCYTRHRDIK